MSHELVTLIGDNSMDRDDFITDSGIDGTPLTLAVLLLAAAGTLAALKMVGFRFVIGVGQ